MKAKKNVTKYVEMPEEALVRILKGKSLQGGMHLDVHTGKIVFNPHNLMRYNHDYQRPPKRLICQLDFGTLKESTRNYIITDSVPKKVGVARAVGIFERDFNRAKNSLMEREIIDRV